METTKTGIKYPIYLPVAVMDVLRWHITRFSPAQLTSDLLFPSEEGGLRCDSVLRKPFKDISKKLGLGYRITPRSMRRTYQDLARRAGVEGLVTRSISGHQTEEMQDWYSTVEAEEQRAALTRIHALATALPQAAE